jgi:HSP20 family protein
MSVLSKKISGALQPGSRRDPIESIQDKMEQLLSRMRLDWNGDAGAVLPVVPPIDIAEDETSLTIRVDVPGWKPEELDVEVSGDQLRISGQRTEEKEEKQQTWHCIERSQGAFSRVVRLPATVKEGQITADCQDGVLTMMLPKVEASKSHKVKIQGLSRPR